MNQEQNSFNTNQFNIQGNNAIPNDQTLNNQNFNNVFNPNIEQNTDVNQAIFNSQFQHASSYDQPIIQDQTQKSMNTSTNMDYQNQIVHKQSIQNNLESNFYGQNNNSKKNNKILLCIVIAVILVSLITSIIIIFLKQKNDNKFDNYLSLNIPLSSDLLLEENYIEKTIYTFIYGDNRVVRRIVFTDVYYLEETAKADYNSYLNNNNYNNYWNKPKRILKINKNVLTYEYNNDIAQTYYSDFIGRTIDDIVKEYGEDKVLNDFIPNLTKNELLYIYEDASNIKDNIDNSSKSDIELIAEQAEKKLSQNFTTNYNEAFNINYQYYATVDKTSIKYTNEYSKDYYYVMNATVRNSSTNFIIGKYLIRCKWDKDSKSIIDYGDNSKIMIVTNVYEEAISKSTKGLGLFYISKDQYKNNIVWDTTKLDKNSFKEILNELDKLNYYYYEYSNEKNESYFNQMKQNQNEIIKKILNPKNITIYTVQVVTNNELQSATSLSTYFNSDLYLANDENFNNLIEYSKNLGLYHEETLNLNNN